MSRFSIFRYQFLPALCYASAVFAVIVCPSVYLSVTSRTCTETAKHRITQTTLHDSPATLVLWRKRCPTGAPNTGEVGKDCVFHQSRSLRLRCLTTKYLCQSATVVRVHDGALAEEYAVSSTTLAVVEVCWSQLRSCRHQRRCCRRSLMITWRLTSALHVWTQSIACWLCDSWAYCNELQ